MQPDQSRLDQQVDSHFFGREEFLAAIGRRLVQPAPSQPFVSIHGITGAGKSLLLHRTLRLARTAGLPVAKIQFDGKDGEESVETGQHLEILRQISLNLNVPTPRFATAYLAWSLGKELNRQDSPSALQREIDGLVNTSVSALVTYVVSASFGPGGLLAAAAQAGWRLMAERVNASPLAAFSSSREGREFAARLKQLKQDDIPVRLGQWLAEDLAASLPELRPGCVRAMVAFDSWEQFELRYADRRSRWHEESQILEFYKLCRSFILFASVGQKPLSWLEEDRSLAAGKDVEFHHLEGLSRAEADGYLLVKRGIESAPWREAMLDATSETIDGGQSTHHPLTLGMIADTAAEILARNPAAHPNQLEVRPNDLEDLVRRFLSVREDQESMIQRLALTPRFDTEAVAAALGKPCDEFNSLADFSAVRKLSFVEVVGADNLSIHRLMRRMLRERMKRYEPERITAAHAAWRRHYLGRGMAALAFRHSLALEFNAALSEWSGRLDASFLAGDADQMAELAHWGREAEDELEHLQPTEAARFLLVRASAARRDPVAHPAGKHRDALAAAYSALERLAGSEPSSTTVIAHIERARALYGLAEIGAHDYDHAAAQDAIEDAEGVISSLGGAVSPSLSLDVALLHSTILRTRGRRLGNPELVEASIQMGRSLLKQTPVNSPQWFDVALELGRALAMSADMRGYRLDELNEAIALLGECLNKFTLEAAPFVWAEIKQLIAQAQSCLAEAGQGSECSRLSRQAHLESAQVVTPWRHPDAWGRLQISLIFTLNSWAEATGEADHCRESVAACEVLLQVVERNADPFKWSLAKGGLGRALRIWGDIEGSADRYRSACHEFEQAILERPREKSPSSWAHAKMNLAITQMHWGRLERRADLLQESVANLSACLEVFHQGNWGSNQALAERKRSEAEQLLEELKG